MDQFVCSKLSLSDCLSALSPAGCSCVGKTGESQCIENQWLCDDIMQCRDGEDERPCPCSNGNDRCPNAVCIENWWKCNGVSECSDGSDELYCPSRGSGNSATSLPVPATVTICAICAVFLMALLIFYKRCKYRDQQRRNRNSRTQGDTAEVVITNDIHVESRGSAISGAFYDQPAPSYEDLIPLGETSSPQAINTVTLAHPNEAELPQPNTQPSAPPQYPSPAELDAPPSYETVMLHGFDARDNTNTAGGDCGD